MEDETILENELKLEMWERGVFGGCGFNSLNKFASKQSIWQRQIKYKEHKKIAQPNSSIIWYIV